MAPVARPLDRLVLPVPSLVVLPDPLDLLVAPVVILVLVARVLVGVIGVVGVVDPGVCMAILVGVLLLE